jgi:hypothetical protein
MTENNTYNIDVIEDVVVIKVDVIDDRVNIKTSRAPLGSLPHRDTVNISSDYTVQDQNDAIIVSAEVNSNITVTLSKATGVLGKTLIIKNRSSQTIMINTQDNELIDDEQHHELYYKNESISLLSDGYNWCIT